MRRRIMRLEGRFYVVLTNSGIRKLHPGHPVDCGDFGSITNAEAPFQDTVSVEQNHYGATVRVRCLSGYVLNGPAQVTCQADGQWSKKPTCDVKPSRSSNTPTYAIATTPVNTSTNEVGPFVTVV
ncbi:hypothetical protein DPMN_013802 [Dreissena polymorpha]|uniref:Sushi domain-containing protein n=1 Tax=Dreissena polymorpha TaxID=45954 RepID=A0A9D4S400_DREPO|nr:hypothetical protein DPMN_013802 [Dreissena polymorpha]